MKTQIIIAILLFATLLYTIRERVPYTLRHVDSGIVVEMDLPKNTGNVKDTVSWYQERYVVIFKN